MKSVAPLAAWMAVGLSPAWSAVAAPPVDTTTTIQTICSTCHGPDGNGITEMYPKLAGQPREYIVKQLGDFLAGRRKNELMAPFLPQLKASKPQELAAHFAALPTSKGVTTRPALLDLGKEIYVNGNVPNGVPGCIGCHGPAAAGVELNARLASQYQSYLLAQLLAFKEAKRDNDKARVMRSAVEHLSAAEAEAVTEYLASL